jgi:hypothetical protein
MRFRIREAVLFVWCAVGLANAAGAQETVNQITAVGEPRTLQFGLRLSF